MKLTMNPKSYSNLLESFCCEHARSETGLVLLQILNDPLDTLRILGELIIVRFIPFYHLFYDKVSVVWSCYVQRLLTIRLFIKRIRSVDQRRQSTSQEHFPQTLRAI